VHLLESELSLLNVEQFDKEFEWVQFKSQKPQKATANVSEMKNFKQQQLYFLLQIALTQHFFFSDLYLTCISLHFFWFDQNKCQMEFKVVESCTSVLVLILS
jgi:hypothetical protein